jgi:hypothetical protein
MFPLELLSMKHLRGTSKPFTVLLAPNGVQAQLFPTNSLNFPEKCQVILQGSKEMYLYPTKQIFVPNPAFGDLWDANTQHLAHDLDFELWDASNFLLEENVTQTVTTSPRITQPKSESPKPIKLSKAPVPDDLQHVESELMDVDLTSPIELGKYDTLTLNPMDSVGDDDFEFFKPKSSNSVDPPTVSTPVAIPEVAHTPLPQTPYYGGNIFSPQYFGQGTPGAQMFSPSPLAINDMGSPVVSPHHRVDTFLSPPATSPYAKQSTPYVPGKAYDTPKMLETLPISADLVVNLSGEEMRQARQYCAEQWIPFRLNLRLLEEDNYGSKNKWHYEPSSTAVRKPRFRLCLETLDSSSLTKTRRMPLSMATLLPDRIQLSSPMILHRQPIFGPDLDTSWKDISPPLFGLQVLLDQLMVQSQSLYSLRSTFLRSVGDIALMEETKHYVSELLESQSDDLKRWTLDELTNLGGKLS